MVDAEILTDGDDLQGQDYGIAAEGMGMAIRAFYQYAKPIDAIVREVASNSFDAHREAMAIPKMSDDELRALGYTGDLDSLRAHFSKWKERDIEIELVSPRGLGSTDRKIIFRDYGVGISPSRMKNIMTKFFSSTKRASNDFIGAFGLGSKSPLGYTNAFQMNTWFFGTRYEYLIHSGATAPRLELIGQFPDRRANGTEVIVPIETETDYGEFRKSVTTQLRYFDGFTIIGLDLKDTTVYRGKHFVYRNDQVVDQMHICLGKVYYPLDFIALGLSSYSEGRVPIGLYFDIGELPVVWNRESIEYTKDSKEIIKQRFEEAKQELQDIWDSQFADIKTAEQFITARAQTQSSSLKLPNGVVIPHVNNILKMEVVWPDHPFVMKDPLYAWEITKLVEDGRTSKTKYYGTDLFRLLLEDKAFLLTVDNVSKPNINSYLNEGMGLHSFYLVKRRFSFDPDDPSIKSISFGHWQLGGKSNWANDQERMDFVATLLEIEEFLLDKSQGVYDDIQIPDEWSEKLRERSKLRRQGASKIPKEQVVIRAKMPLTLRPLVLEGYNSAARYFIHNTTIGDVEKHKGTFIYGGSEDHDLLLAAQFAVSQMRYDTEGRWNLLKQKVIVVKVAQDTMRVLDEIPRCIHVKAFMNSPSGFWRRWLTAQLLTRAWPVGTEVFQTTTQIPILVSIKKKMNDLRNYSNSYTRIGWIPRTQEAILEQQKERLMQMGHWDQEIVNLFKTLVAFAWRWRLLRYINMHAIPDDDLLWIMEQVGMDNPELLYRNSKRKGLITNNNDEDEDE